MRKAKGLAATPTFATNVLKLPPEPAATLQKRITEALGKSSHGVEIALIEDSPDSFLQIGAELLQSNEINFLKKSGDLAIKLAKAQSNKDLPASKLFVALGRCGSSRNKYLLAIKAEMQDGFTENSQGLEHLTELFLTPSQKLFKIGLLVEIVSAAPDDEGLYNIDNFAAHLYDHLLNTLETREAAQYFYSGFLGSQPIVSDKTLTKQFFELTTKFVNTAPIDQARKIELFEALRVELRSNSAVLHVETFAKMHIPQAQQAPYVAYMDGLGFTRNAVTKNLEFVKTRLKQKQRMRFDQDVEISAPADKLHQLVVVQSTTATETILKICAAIKTQE
jgi:hypothetical protein